ncbi:MFS transporter [Amycolatopsis sp. YIM 10]|uniref:MFS transporter n=1 Tax=Amycolatopsis sp. YIM 10 TaxID=2653857 RepID=UPI00128FD63E|nr:MFS transporter [Amycolatopsis sp. YIM 10]QFU89770.1 Inner membrane metabolite transport protein YgcS [Amycolatopsis sp. YIM 10]
MTTLDDVPVTRFHRRLVTVAMGGPFCDGYLLGIIAVALGQLTPQLGLGSVWSGLIASSALIGVFIGAMVFGAITDRIGRRLMYVLNLAVFVAASVPQFFVTEAWQLFVLRLIIGIAVGADYPIASAITAELVPRKLRGPALSGLILSWWIGYGVSYWVGLALKQLGDDGWRWMLLSGAVPAVVFLLMRTGVPESPRWLASRGRIDEATEIVRKFVGPRVSVDDLVRESAVPKRGGSGLGNIAELFRRGYTKTVVFCSAFFLCQVATGYAIRTFQPEILEKMGVGNATASSAILMLIPILGVSTGLLLVNRIGRRPLLIATFVAIFVSLLCLAVLPLSLALPIILLFVLFHFAEAAGSALQFLYPSELFPTDLRATGVGFASAMSRFGSAGGTFFLPLLIAGIGNAGTLLVGAAITLVGLGVSLALAPETKGLALTDAGHHEETAEERTLS